MIPSEYRLEEVVARLTERLDSARRSFDDDESARAGFTRIAEDHVAAAAAEWRELGFDADPDRHARFLRDEVMHTFLPRFTSEAVAMTRSEREGHGMGAAAAPMGRIGLVVAGVFAFLFCVQVAFRFPPAWALVALSMSVPFLPDISAWLAHRRYHQVLGDIVDDMERIQEQGLAYLPSSSSAPDAASATDPGVRARPPAQREGQ